MILIKGESYFVSKDDMPSFIEEGISVNIPSDVLNSFSEKKTFLSDNITISMPIGSKGLIGLRFSNLRGWFYPIKCIYMFKHYPTLIQEEMDI